MSFAGTKVLNSQEEVVLESIVTKWDDGYKTLNIESTLNEYNKVLTDLNLIEENKISTRSFIEKDIDLLSEVSLKGEYDNSLSEKIKNKSNYLRTLIESYASKSKLLSKINSDVALKESKLRDLEQSKNKEIISLYQRVKSRAILDSSKAHIAEYSGKLKCDTYESIQDCINRNKNEMKKSFKLGLGLFDSVLIKDFKVTNASQNMNGDLNYSIKSEYVIKFDDTIDKRIRNELGLTKISFTLKSNNENVTYYIDDKKVGKGKLVNVTGDYNGIKNVIAKMEEKSQSLRLSLKPNEVYYFPFKNKNKNKNKNNSFISNEIVFSGNGVYYLSPTSNKDTEKYPLALSFNDANAYCKNELSSNIATREQYDFLFKSNVLVDIEYWTNDGDIYTLNKSNKQRSKKHFLCTMNTA